MNVSFFDYRRICFCFSFESFKSFIIPLLCHYVQAGAVGGGFGNHVRSNYAVVLGGYRNHAQARFAIVVGGAKNTVNGRFGIAMGYNAKVTGDYSGVCIRGLL